MDLFRLVVMGAATVAFVRWLLSAYRRAEANGRVSLRFSPAEACWTFFIPILSLYQPFQAMQDLFVASAADRNPYQEDALPQGSSALLWLWLCELAAAFVGNRAFAKVLFGQVQSLDDWRGIRDLDTAHAVLHTLAGGLLIGFMRTVDQRLDARAVAIVPAPPAGDRVSRLAPPPARASTIALNLVAVSLAVIGLGLTLRALVDFAGYSRFANSLMMR